MNLTVTVRGKTKECSVLILPENFRLLKREKYLGTLVKDMVDIVLKAEKVARFDARGNK